MWYRERREIVQRRRLRSFIFNLESLTSAENHTNGKSFPFANFGGRLTNPLDMKRNLICFLHLGYYVNISHRELSMFHSGKEIEICNIILREIS